MKLVDGSGVEAQDWSLTPSRYVIVALEEVDENFEEGPRSTHIDLIGLNEATAELAKRIAKNFEEMGA